MRSRERQQQILDAALHCFVTYGYEETGIDAIREYSGASVGSIYHHFKNKQGVAVALRSRILERFWDQVTEPIRDEPDVRSALSILIHGYIHWVCENPIHARFVFESSGIVREKTGQDRQIPMIDGKPLCKWFLGRYGSESFQPISMHLIPALVIAPIQSYAKSRIYNGGKPPNEEHVRQLSDAICRSILL